MVRESFFFLIHVARLHMYSQILIIFKLIFFRIESKGQVRIRTACIYINRLKGRRRHTQGSHARRNCSGIAWQHCIFGFSVYLCVGQSPTHTHTHTRCWVLCCWNGMSVISVCLLPVIVPHSYLNLGYRFSSFWKYYCWFKWSLSRVPPLRTRLHLSEMKKLS